MRQYSSKAGPNKKRYGHDNNRTPQKRGWKAPSHLSVYERSVWLMNSFNGRFVKLRPNESVDNLLRRFKKKVEQAGIMKELKSREYHLTSSQKKREKRKKALKRLRKLEKKMGTGRIDEEIKPEFQKLRDDIFGLD